VLLGRFDSGHSPCVKNLSYYSDIRMDAISH
jgi:hypothetical protein